MADYAGYGIPEVPQGVVVTATGQLSLADGSTPTRQVFEKMVDMHGVWVVYARAQRGFPCTRCRPNEARPGEGDGNCPVCLGLGYKAKLERVKAVLSRGRRTMANEADIIPGKLGDSDFRVFFKVEDQPASGDIILEVIWNTPAAVTKYAGEPSKILHVYSIEQIETFYFGGLPTYEMSVLDPFDHHLQPITQALSERRK